MDPQNLIPVTHEENNLAYRHYPNSTNSMPASIPLETTFPDSSTYRILWNTYQDDLYGFNFKYPAVYEEPAHKDQCGLKVNEAGIYRGKCIDLQILDSVGLGLEDFASNLLQGKDWSLDAQTIQEISELEGITIQYRFEGTNQFGTISLVEYNGRIFVFNFSAGSFCDILNHTAQISEGAVYTHLPEAFLFNKQKSLIFHS